MPHRITRRGALLMGAAPLLARPAAAGQTQPAGSPESLLATQRKDLCASAAELAKVKVPMATEPAFVFKA